MSLITGVCVKRAPMTGPSYCGAASFNADVPPSALVSVGFPDDGVAGAFGAVPLVGSCFDSLQAASPPAAPSAARRTARIGRERIRGGVLTMLASMEAPIEVGSLLAYENGEEETSFWRSWDSVLCTW